MYLALSSLTPAVASEWLAGAWYRYCGTVFTIVLFEIPIEDSFLAEITMHFPIRTLTPPMRLQPPFLQFPLAGQAADAVMQTPQRSVLPPHREVAVFAGTFHQRESAVYVDMVLHFAPLDLGLAALITLRTLHDQLVNNIDQNLTRRGPRTELGGRAAGRTVSSRAMRRVCTIRIPSLSDTIPAEAVIAFR